MKFFVPFLLLFFFFACKSQSPKVDYNYPVDITSKNKKLLTAELNHGMKLYKIHCSVCHGIIGNGKDSVPNFSKKQFDAYTAKILANSNLTHQAARKLGEEDLAAIFKFLQYFKRKD